MGTIFLTRGRAVVKEQFDPKKIETIFRLVSEVRTNILSGALNAAMANLVKATKFYLTTQTLKKEREVLEEDFYDLLIKIAKHPKFADTYGPVSFRQGEHKMNVEFMEQLIMFGAESLRDKIEQGLELLAAERFEGARAIFQEVVDNPDADLDHFVAIGDAYLKRQRWSDAQDIFSLAMDRFPESIHLLNRMAISYRKDSKFEEALDAYRQAIKLSPKDEGLYYNLARLFLDMSRPENAVQALRKALAINPRFDRASKLLTSVQAALTPAKEKAEDQG